MESYHRLYDYKLGAQSAGSVEIQYNGDRLVQTFRQAQNSQTNSNPLEVKLEGSRIHSYRSKEGSWIEVTSEDPPRIPTWAVLHILSQVEDTLQYMALDDETGKELGLTLLSRAGDWIFESRGYSGLRKFQMKGSVPVEVISGISSLTLQSPTNV